MTDEGREESQTEGTVAQAAEELDQAVEDAAEAAQSAETPAEVDHWTSIHAELTSLRAAVEQLSLRGLREVETPAETAGTVSAAETPVVVAVEPAAEPPARRKRRRRRLL